MWGENVAFTKFTIKNKKYFNINNIIDSVYLQTNSFKTVWRGL